MDDTTCIKQQQQQKVKTMIRMNFKNYDNGQTRYVICDKRDSRCFDWSMNDKGFVWVSTIIL